LSSSTSEVLSRQKTLLFSFNQLPVRSNLTVQMPSLGTPSNWNAFLADMTEASSLTIDLIFLQDHASRFFTACKAGPRFRSQNRLSDLPYASAHSLLLDLFPPPPFFFFKLLPSRKCSSLSFFLRASPHVFPTSSLAEQGPPPLSLNPDCLRDPQPQHPSTGCLFSKQCPFSRFNFFFCQVPKQV